MPLNRCPAAKKLPDIVARFVRRAMSLGPVEARPMFGGHGLYLDGVIFALEADGCIWLKVDDDAKPQFMASGSRAFVYRGKNRSVEMSYWLLPDGAETDPGAFLHWAELALAAGRRSIARKRTPSSARRRVR
ncbi:MAG: TfoX/Sxy family protein [Dongiaceae bacterium]